MTPSHDRRSIRKHLLVSMLMAGALVASIGGWAGTAELSRRRDRQRRCCCRIPTLRRCSILQAVLLENYAFDNDQLVNAGDVVVRLDETQTKANLAVFTKSLDELYARQARLEAEKDGAESIEFPGDLLARESNDPQVAHILEGERKLFSLRNDARNGEKAQLREREQPNFSWRSMV